MTVFVQLFAEAFRKHPAFLHGHRWILNERSVQQLRQRQAAVDVPVFLKNRRILKQRQDFRHLAQCFLQTLAVDCIGRTIGHSGNQPFHIIDLVQLVLEILADKIVFH